ncbi:MAG: hypothetical protein J5535_06250 [Firmicutes bacterium]|nr:hypothetical protein [Bacillota bacterium]
MTQSFIIPLILFIKNFDLESVLLACGIPLLAGMPIAFFCNRKTAVRFLCISGAAAVVITILFQFQRKIHFFGNFGLLVGPIVTALFIGLALGLLLNVCFKKR